MTGLTSIWLLLIALTAATTALAASAVLDRRLVAGLLLALAFMKARTILAGFLHLKPATGWLSVATVPLAIWLALIWGLYAI